MSAAVSPIRTDINYERDGKQHAYLRVPQSSDRSGWGSLLIPITVIKNGTGPTVLLTGGLHGDEYEGVVALMKLGRSLQAGEIRGRVIIIPALNLPAVRAGTRLSPLDGKDMNRVFPGRVDGTTSEVIAHYVRTTLLPLADAVIDLHAGGTSMDFLPYISMHYLDDPQQHARTFAALEAFGAPVALLIREMSGEGLIDYEVERAGKIFLCAELGGAGRLSPRALRIAENGVRNLLKHFEIIAGEPLARGSQGERPTQLMEVPDERFYHVALANGIYEARFELGDRVEGGTHLGQIHFVEEPERPPQPIIAGRSGTLIVTRGPGWIERGDMAAVLARDLDAN